MTLNNVPIGWSFGEIGLLCNLINGRAFKPIEWKEFGLPIIRIQNLNNSSASFNYFDGDIDEKHKVYKNDLLFAWSGTPGTSFGAHVWKGGEAVLNQHIFKITFNKIFLDRTFLRYAINQKLDELIAGAQGGVGLRHVTKSTFEKTEIVLPPLAEQKQIADRLDALLAQVDTLKTRLDAIPAILKRFRQSVLAAAVSGKLTEGWRGASELKGWEILKIEKIISSLVQGWSPKCLNYSANESEWGVVKTSAIQELYFVKSENKKLPDNLEPRPELSVVKNDILITRAGPRSRCGITCIVEREYPKLMICDKVYRVRVDNNIIHPNLLNYQLNSPTLLFDIEKIKTGTSENGMNLTQKKFIDLQIKLPPIKEQTEIVRRVDQLFAFADQIEQRVAEARKRVDHLTQSILAKAFRGDLTAEWRAENPDLISGENSAEALLERIKAERDEAAASPARKTGRRRTGS